jgi:hypothetical protein
VARPDHLDDEDRVIGKSRTLMKHFGAETLAEPGTVAATPAVSPATLTMTDSALSCRGWISPQQ